MYSDKILQKISHIIKENLNSILKKNKKLNFTLILFSEIDFNLEIRKNIYYSSVKKIFLIFLLKAVVCFQLVGWFGLRFKLFFNKIRSIAQ